MLRWSVPKLNMVSAGGQSKVTIVACSQTILTNTPQVKVILLLYTMLYIFKSPVLVSLRGLDSDMEI